MDFPLLFFCGPLSPYGPRPLTTNGQTEDLEHLSFKMSFDFLYFHSVTCIKVNLPEVVGIAVVKLSVVSRTVILIKE